MLREMLSDALKTAQKAKDSQRIQTLRLIRAAIKDRDISLKGEGKDAVDEGGIIEILSKMIKQRNESIKAYEEGGRLELAEQERQEIEIVQEFLPPQLSDTEIKKVCEDAVKELKAESLKDMGRVMAKLKENYAGQIDFATAGTFLRELLKSS